MVYLIDNYDSFSYNLYQYVGELLYEKPCVSTVEGDSAEGTHSEKAADRAEASSYGQAGDVSDRIRVIRNDELTCEELSALRPSHLILSPGPGRPGDAGICEEAVRYFEGKLPILGVCLGHQAICEAYGGVVGHAPKLMHGKQSIVQLKHSAKGDIFAGLSEELAVARYHSLIAENESLPDCLAVTARTKENEIMAVQHKEYPTYGLQFHPESILTPEGKKILKHFLEM